MFGGLFMVEHIGRAPSPLSRVEGLIEGVDVVSYCCEYTSAVCRGLLDVKQQAASHHTPMSLRQGGSDTLPFQGGYIYTVLTLIEIIQQRSHR
jgi:hypothetical protein